MSHTPDIGHILGNISLFPTAFPHDSTNKRVARELSAAGYQAVVTSQRPDRITLPIFFSFVTAFRYLACTLYSVVAIDAPCSMQRYPTVARRGLFLEFGLKYLRVDHGLP